LFHDGTTVGLGDGQLLARYAADRDEAAFAALVARHGPMVLATCRAVLRHEPDVEDAFQATFLVLARKARTVRAGEALGGWLHRVAYRAAIQAGAESRRRHRREAEAAAMRTLHTTHSGPEPDLAAIVQQEVDRLPDRQRLPVVLCDLEGLTYEQAAGRLRWTEPTLRHQLLKARRRLRERLTRRGLTAGSVGVVQAAATGDAKAEVPAALARSAVAAATGGASTATAAIVAAAIIRGMIMTKLKIAAAGTLAAIALATAGVVAVGAGRDDGPRPALRAPGAVGGAAVARPAQSVEAKPQAPAGSAPGIEGRIVDLEGRPVAGARIQVPNLWSAPGNDLGRWLDRARDTGVDGPWEGLSPSPANLTATTGPDGRFRLAGVGPEQLAEILVSGPTIATAQLYVMGRDGAEVRATAHQARTPAQIVFHARRFDYAASPAKPVEGIISDKDTGRPIAGLTLRASVFDEHSLIPAPGIEAKTDAKGHYRLAGLPKAPAYRVFIEPGKGQPYTKATFRAAGDTPAFDPLKFDVALKRGVLVRGKVTDKATGRPISGYVDAYAFQDNTHVDEFPGFRVSLPAYSPITDGRYEVVALPGRGLICARSGEMERYRGYVGAEAIKGYDSRSMTLPTRPFICSAANYHVVAEINPDPKAETMTLDLRVDPGRTIAVNPVDPEGRPVAGTKAAGVSDLFSSTEYSQPTARIEIRGLDPSRPRRVIVAHAERKLIGSVYLKGDETGPLTIRLQPYGTVTGRVVDEDGRPRGGLGIISAGGSFPGRPAEQGILPGGNVGPGIRIGHDGRFRIEGLVPGLKYGAGATDGFRYGGELFRDVTVASGEVKDLGDLKLIPPRRGG
jgi:RNA polymerase sigma factor (sigma-70 family)